MTDKVSEWPSTRDSVPCSVGDVDLVARDGDHLADTVDKILSFVGVILGSISSHDLTGTALAYQVPEALSLASEFHAAFLPYDLPQVIFTRLGNLGQCIRLGGAGTGTGTHHLEVLQCFSGPVQFIGCLSHEKKHLGISGENDVFSTVALVGLGALGKGTYHFLDW